ncbi:DUF1460 domain-containing protein [Mongoliitalea daihaiensis]|nr:DUF1460 domain-containing protein [Mongoliitalea daihaiensis]
MKYLVKRFFQVWCVGFLPFLGSLHAQTICTPENKLAVERISQKMDQLPEELSDRITAIGEFFLNTPYVEKTLEITDDESLIINILGFDCTTFVESVIALNRSRDLLKYGIGPFENALTFVRYRAGVRNGYPSRLHYFSDWMSDAVAKGVLRDITQDIGGVKYPNKPTFMSENPQFYPQLANEFNLNAMKMIEKGIAEQTYYYIPKDQVQSIEHKIKNGDLIAITASMANLDMVHVGFAVQKNGRIHLLHASSSSKKVEISEKPLHEYLQATKSQSGIMVGRLRP